MSRIKVIDMFFSQIYEGALPEVDLETCPSLVITKVPFDKASLTSPLPKMRVSFAYWRFIYVVDREPASPYMSPSPSSFMNILFSPSKMRTISFPTSPLLII